MDRPKMNDLMNLLKESEFHLPNIECCTKLLADNISKPSEIISSIIHKGSKMLIAGTSKSYKSWCLMDLALSIANGNTWLDFPTTESRVLFIDFELPKWALKERINALIEARPSNCKTSNLALWNLRGYAADLEELKPRMIDHLVKHNYDVLIFDPVYKVLGDRDENSNGDIATLMNIFDQIIKETNSAIIFAHHFPKGNASEKRTLDRMSGASSWARDPDTLMIFTPHECEESFTITTVVRNHPPVKDFCVTWKYPLMTRDDSLDPRQIEKDPSRTDTDAIRVIIDEISQGAKSYDEISRHCKDRFMMNEPQIKSALQKLLLTGRIGKYNGFYILTR